MRKGSKYMNSKINAFVVADSKKCIGCKACEVACYVAHNDKENLTVTAGNIEMPIIARLHVVDNGSYKVPVQCRQCEDAPCANVCPIGAITEQGDKIIIDENKCIGCKTCAVACPFGAIDILPRYENGEKLFTKIKKSGEVKEAYKAVSTAYKCDLCNGSDKPACVDACPKNALKVFHAESERKERNIASVLSL